MNLPEHMTFIPEYSDGRALHGTLSFDLTGWVETIRSAYGRMTEAMQDAVVAFNRIAQVMRAYANDEVRVCGLEAAYYARGSVTTNIDAFVLAVLTNSPYQEDLLALTVASRSRLAAAAVSGYVSHRAGEQAETFSWHRQIGPTYVSVGRE